MGFVADAVSSVVGGVADAVGTVADTALSVAGDVVDAVASNPLLIAAAVAAPVALGGLAAEAGAGAAFSAADVGLSGLGTGMLEAGIPSALDIGAGLGYGTAAGMGAGTLAGTAAAVGAGVGASGLGSIYADGAITDAFNFAPIDQATNFGTSVLDASSSNLAVFDSSQTAASTVMGNSPTMAFDSNYLNSSMFTQAQDAASLAQSPGMSFSNAVSTATDGAIAPSNATSMFTNAWDSAKGLVQQANDFTNKIGQTIAPNADPMVQKAITNFGTNMVTTGGDVEQSLKGTAIGTGVGLVGKEVTDLTSSMLGSTGSKIAGGAAGNVAGAIASGASPEQALIGGAAGAAGAGVTNLTGSPLVGNLAKSVTGSTLSGGDVGTSLINTGLNTGLGYLNQQLGITPTSTLGKIVSPLESGLISSFTSNAPKSASMLASLGKTNISPLSSIAKSTSSPTSAIVKSGTSGVQLPPQKVDVTGLTPVNLSSLGIKT